MTDERRATPRIEVETFVKDLFSPVEPEAGSGIIFRLLTNLSEGGAFVVDRLQSLDTVCKLEIPIPDGSALEVEAEVVRRTADGAAVRFLGLSGEERERLARLSSRS